MTTKVGIAVLAALVVVLGGCGQEGGGALQAGWPVPGVETRAQLEVSLVVEGPVDVDGGTLYGARLLSWITVQVTPGGEGAKRALVRTQGEVAGSVDIEEKGEPRRTRLFPGGGQLSSLLFGRGGLPGATATRMLDGAPSSEEVAAAAWTLLGLVPPPPGDAALAAGTAWTGDAAWPLFPARVQPARFEIESMDAETIRVHATWLGADFEVGWSAPAADLVVDVSRRDGLALAASLDVTLVSTEDAPDGDGVVPIPVKGTVKRISWTEPPAGPVDVEAVAMDLAASDPVTRAKAATRLGALWPDAGRVAPALVGAFDDADVRVREAATGALRHLAELNSTTICRFASRTRHARRAPLDPLAGLRVLRPRAWAHTLRGRSSESGLSHSRDLLTSPAGEPLRSSSGADRARHGPVRLQPGLPRRSTGFGQRLGDRLAAGKQDARRRRLDAKRAAHCAVCASA